MTLMNGRAENNLTREVLDLLEQYNRDLVEWRDLQCKSLKDPNFHVDSYRRKEELRESLLARADYFWDLGISVY
jgi:hypothetical protein